MDRRVAAADVPANNGRRVSSAVSGCATLMFGAMTILLVAMVVGSKGWVGVLASIPIVVLFGGATFGFGFLTWRWARSLPPSARLALDDREKDELAK